MSGPRALIRLRHEPHGTPLKFEEPVTDLLSHPSTWQSGRAAEPRGLRGCSRRSGFDTAMVPTRTRFRCHVLAACQGPIGIRKERLVGSTFSFTGSPASPGLAAINAGSGAPARDDVPGIAASQSAIGSGSVRPTCASLRFRRSEA